MLLLPTPLSTLLLLIICVSTSILAPIVEARGPSSSAHPHQGKVTPFQPGDPNVKLDGKALTILSNGNPFQTQIQSGTSGRGLVVQDVKAPTNVVWDRILDYNNYAKMVPKTIESQNYKVEKHGKKEDSPQTIYTRMKVGFPMVKLQFFVKHEYQPKLNSLTWTLDYSKKSDFDDSCGYWFVVPHPDNPNWTRVYYSVEVSMFDWVPKFVVQFMSNKALTDATGWVKKFSELEYEKQGGDKAAVAQVESSSSVAPENKKHFGWFGSKKSAEESTDDETCDEASVESSTSTSVAATTEKEEIGLKRYALMLSVVALSFYNVHLYFSL